MRILDSYPTRSFHRPGDGMELVAELDASDGGLLRAQISQLSRVVDTIERRVERPRMTLRWQPPADAPCGFGVDLELIDQRGHRRATASTAFDVLDAWTDFPRYGFFSDFPPDRDDLAEAVGVLARHHINALQFYDWQYRHDDLIAAADCYDDPLGRKLSGATVRRAVDAAHSAGMAAMAYVAIYAASAAFWRSRPDWALYDRSGQPHVFGENFLGLMNPARRSPWALHLLDQCARALTEVGFDGIHLDQYGEPRQAQDAHGAPVDLPAAFVDFITDLKARKPCTPVAMNAVKNWPSDALATSQQNFTYIELWPDTPTYQDLIDVVLQARRQATRPVVIALYLPADHSANIETANALLFATGASRIQLGEAGRLLTDPYFPNHQPVPDDLGWKLRRGHDLAVRYGQLVGPAAQCADDVQVRAQPNIWTHARRNGTWLGLNLVNITDLNTRWDRPHSRAQPLADLELSIASPAPIVRAWCASPGQPAMRPLTLVGDEYDVRITVPYLDCWSLVMLETELERQTND
jgi:dextranase